jgi:23S rRNA (cytosine1962-C5)-methyltransferase
VVDKYGDILSVQLHSFGMDRLREEILDCLEQIFHPRGILERSDPRMRKNEGLPSSKGVLRGTVPEDPLTIREHGLQFLVDVHGGQKTGFYLDQRDNRRMVNALARGRRVLDAFTYTGAFAVHAAAGGASEVLALDSSEKFIALARQNAEINDAGSIRFEKADVLTRLAALGKEKEAFDLIILDPPKFARSAHALKKALSAYRELNLLALRLLSPEGILVSCSCSHHVTEENLENTIRKTALQAKRRLALFHRGGQAPDHPVGLFCPEGRYLKSLFLRAD